MEHPPPDRGSPEDLLGIAAIGVAERVAAERGERCGAGAVGYAVRGEVCTSAATRLLFCTTGVLPFVPRSGSPRVWGVRVTST